MGYVIIINCVYYIWFQSENMYVQCDIVCSVYCCIRLLRTIGTYHVYLAKTYSISAILLYRLPITLHVGTVSKL